MRLFIPQLVVSENEGFAEDKDIFNRKPFGETLLQLVNNIEDEIVIALDSKWGEGKTTFIKMWQGLLSENNINSIYFDAFANDYIDDPFIALSGEIYELAKINAPPDKLNEYKAKMIKVGKVLLKSGVKIGLKSLTLGALDGTEVEEIGIDKDIASEASKISENYLSSVLESYQEDKNCFESFRTAISDIAECITKEDSPLIFIIDELDRCKPTFALELLEKIKHVFSIPKIVFVLVMNREQLEEAVRCQYGSGIKATPYLQKFINIWCNLPKNNLQHVDDSERYFRYLLNQHDFPINNRYYENVIRNMVDYIEFYSLSLREIEQSAINLVLSRRISQYDRDSGILLPFLAVVKVTRPTVFNKLKLAELSYNDVISELNLADLNADWFERKEEKHPLPWMLRFCLAPDEELEKLPEGYFTDVGFMVDYRRDIIPRLCLIMSTFKT